MLPIICNGPLKSPSAALSNLEGSTGMSVHICICKPVIFYCLVDNLPFMVIHHSHPLNPIYRRWDTQSPMPIGKLVLFYKAMGICSLWMLY